jgi:hypothetical protein
MANSGLLDYSRIDLQINDTVNSNNRNRYSFASASVNGGTIPSNPNGTNWMVGSGATAPTTKALTAAYTVSAFDISQGIVVLSATAARTATIDTASNIVGMVNTQGAGAAVGDVLQLLFVNGGTTAINVAFGTGGTTDTNIATTAVGATSSRFFLIRLTNVTGGSEGYTVYF